MLAPPSQMLFLDESTSDLNFLSCMVFARSSCIYTPGFNFYDGISYTTSTKTTCSSEFLMTAVILDIMFFHSLCYTFVVNGADIFCVEVTTVRTSRSISFTPSTFGVIGFLGSIDHTCFHRLFHTCFHTPSKWAGPTRWSLNRHAPHPQQLCGVQTSCRPWGSRWPTLWRSWATWRHQ